MPTGGQAQDTERKRFRAIMHGRVQGVSFRYYAREKAQLLGLVGYVRNDWDGSVEVVAEGQEGDLQTLLKWLHRGPSLAHVSRVDVTWQTPAGEYQDFEVRG